MLNKLKKQEFLISVSDTLVLKEGSFIYREGNGKCHLSRFIERSEDGGIVLENVIDLDNISFFVEEGILYPSKKDMIYMFDSIFTNDALSIEAMKIVEKWALLERYPELRKDIIEFIKLTFPPKLIIFLKELNALNYIFIPVQQRFNIGRYENKFQWDNLNRENFRYQLDNLIKEEYITYMAYLPNNLMDRVMFYTSGNETHMETDNKLKKEPFLYSSNCGGNIKLMEEDSQCKRFLVDVGSSYKGEGVNATLDEAHIISSQLKSIYPEYRFIPVEGRGAIGTKNCF